MNHDWVLTDLESVIPPSDGSRISRVDAWQITDYETDAFSGTLASVSPNGRPPPIHIPLPLSGRYDILIGMQVDMCDRLRIKLGSDRCFDRLRYDIPASAGHKGFQEVLWRTVDLAEGETLTLAKDSTLRASVGYVAARKAGPAPAAPARQYLVHVTDDGFPANWGRPDDVEEATWMVDRLARRNVDIVSRGTEICGMANYTTGLDSHRIDAAAALGDQFCRDIDRVNMEVLARFARENTCVPKHYFEVARRHGMQPFGYHRMAHVNPPFPWQTYGSRFYDDHPECRCIDLDGRPVNRLSYAYPLVRRALTDLMVEVIELGAAGINNVFVRGLPAVLYEEPVRQRFREKHGGDVTQLPENDPRAQEVRAEFVTQYMREQRERLDAAAGGRATIMATVPATRAVCDFYGLDLRTWTREGLVDRLCPYGFGLDAGAADLDMAFHCETVEGTDVQCLPFVNTWRDREAVAFLEKALALTRWPIAGLSFWDAASRGPGFDQALASLSSVDAMRAAIERLKAHRPVHHEILMLDGVKHSKYNFGWNF